MAAPFLGSVAERAAKAQTCLVPGRSEAAHRDVHPLRLRHEPVVPRQVPRPAHGRRPRCRRSSTPLAPFAGKLLIPRGIRAMNEWTAANTARMGAARATTAHADSTGSYFTCSRSRPTATTRSASTGDQVQRQADRPSLDHVMAQQLSPTGTPLFMRVGNFNDSGTSGVSYKKADGAAIDAAARHLSVAWQRRRRPSAASTGLFKSGAR